MSASEYLLELPRWTDAAGAAYKPGLERIEALLAAIDDPHRRYPAVHVAGTNGKGSTCSMIAAIGTAAGLKVGLHTSPHLHHVGERMRVNGVPADEAWLDDAVARLRPVFERERPSFFEATVALSFLYFAEKDVDLAVVEVGMGGRFDATNVLDPLVSVITRIGLDHTEFLGDTLEAIASEKAGILKPGRPAVVGPDQAGLIPVFRDSAEHARAFLHDAGVETRVRNVVEVPDGLRLDLDTDARKYPDLRVALRGLHQVENIRTAVRAAEFVFDFGSPAYYGGLAHVDKLTGLRGRLEVLSEAPLVVADVSHNPDGLAASIAYMKRRIGPHGRLCVAFGLMRDKDAANIASMLARADAAVFLLELEGPRAASPGALASVMEAAGVRVLGHGTPAEARASFLAPGSPFDGLLLAGSFQVVAAL